MRAKTKFAAELLTWMLVFVALGPLVGYFVFASLAWNLTTALLLPFLPVPLVVLAVAYMIIWKAAVVTGACSYLIAQLIKRKCLQMTATGCIGGVASTINFERTERWLSLYQGNPKNLMTLFVAGFVSAIVCAQVSRAVSRRINLRFSSTTP